MMLNPPCMAKQKIPVDEGAFKQQECLVKWEERQYNKFKDEIERCTWIFTGYETQKKK